MIYITGDTHGDFRRYFAWERIAHPTAQDTMIVLGDAGLNYYGNEWDEQRKAFVNSFPFTTFCIHGNHEMRPDTLQGYERKQAFGATVWVEEKYPHILFAKDGEIYRFDQYSCIVIGGAYSVDKAYRLERGLAWFADEQSSPQIKAYVESQLKQRGNQIDIVLSHTSPIQYEPTEVFLKGLDQSSVDKSTEEWLGRIEKNLTYRRWYCGHYHTEKKIDRMRFLYENIAVLGEDL